MNPEELIKNACEHVKNQHYRLTMHAEREREEDSLTLKEIEECFESDRIELIENYPEDARGHSFLLLGYTDDSKAVHFVCSFHEEELILVTLYRPDPLKWKNERERIL